MVQACVSAPLRELPLARAPVLATLRPLPPLDLPEGAPLRHPASGCDLAAIPWNWTVGATSGKALQAPRNLPSSHHPQMARSRRRRCHPVTIAGEHVACDAPSTLAPPSLWHMSCPWHLEPRESGVGAVAAGTPPCPQGGSVLWKGNRPRYCQCRPTGCGTPCHNRMPLRSASDPSVCYPRRSLSGGRVTQQPSPRSRRWPLPHEHIGRRAPKNDQSRGCHRNVHGLAPMRPPRQIHLL
mmetsp:Transcript_26578/g.52042  ORF Transcript_26578/g.52042 Transcript_26578/m.52042 type:complete len:239 (+) Transcript_26578:225-941(+)